MNSCDPIVSIIIPVYNAAATIERTLTSLEVIDVARRSAVEVVVINDGSIDESLTIIERITAALPEFRWRIESQRNGGLSVARNAAIRLSQGEWIFFLDADDELKFNLAPVFLAAGDATGLGFSLEYRRGGKAWRARPTLLSPETWADELTARNPFQPSSLAFRRDAIKFPFDEQIDVVNDWLFWMQNPGIFARMKVHPEIVSAVVHIHQNNMSSAYARAGYYRTKVAELVTALYREQLSNRQRNNLTVQKCIGQLQQGMRIPLRAFVQFPCDWLLYAKLWVYALARLTGLRATPYRTSDPQRNKSPHDHTSGQPPIGVEERIADPSQ